MKLLQVCTGNFKKRMANVYEMDDGWMEGRVPVPPESNISETSTDDSVEDDDFDF